MKQEIAQQWTTALRSGEYQQGAFNLRTADNKFCCLGVLCVLYAKSHPDSADMEYMRNAAYLPKKVQEWAGMESARGDYFMPTMPFYRNTLANDNDFNNRSFVDIADTIDTYWEQL